MHLLINSVYIFLGVIVVFGTIVPIVLEAKNGFNMVKTAQFIGVLAIIYGSVALLTLGLNAMTQ